MEEQKFGSSFSEFWYLVEGKNFFPDLLAFTLKMRIGKSLKPASMATKRAFLDGWLFLISLVAHLDPGHDYSFPYERVSVLYNGMDYQIQQQTVDMRAEVLDRATLLNMIQSHFDPHSEQRAILGIYTCLPLRDDLQLLWVPGLSGDEVYRTVANEYKESLLLTTGKKVYIYIAHSKTIKQGHLYHLTDPRAVQFVMDYLGRAPVITMKYPFGTEKNSWRICNWTGQMGIKMILKGPKGKILTRRAGIDYFRRVNKAAETSSDDPVQIGENLADSAHSAMTALKYRASVPRQVPGMPPNHVSCVLHYGDPGWVDPI